VGIVGPRLTYPETAKVQQAGWILGLRGTAASVWNNDAEITDPGYMGRALCDQNVSAVAARPCWSGAACSNNWAAWTRRFPSPRRPRPVPAHHRRRAKDRLDALRHAGPLRRRLLKARQRKPEGARRSPRRLAANDRLLERWLPASPTTRPTTAT
jgi:hypothetical protein